MWSAKCVSHCLAFNQANFHELAELCRIQKSMNYTQTTKKHLLVPSMPKLVFTFALEMYQEKFEYGIQLKKNIYAKLVTLAFCYFCLF